jgi:hypothetical protein
LIRLRLFGTSDLKYNLLEGEIQRHDHRRTQSEFFLGV